MAKHPTSSRVHRGDDAPDDAFVSAVKRTVTWTRENQRLVTIVAAVVLVVGAGSVWYISQQQSLEATAATRLSQVQQSVASGNTELAIRDLQSFLSTFGSTDAGDQARLILADLLIGQERGEEALQALGSLPDRLDDPFGLPAARLEASALEALGRYDEAAAAYERLAENARFTYQQRQALADAARVHMQHGNPGAAADLYQRVADTFEEGEAGLSYYRMWLAEARAQARAAVAPAEAPPAAGTPADEGNQAAGAADQTATPDTAGG